MQPATTGTSESFRRVMLVEDDRDTSDAIASLLKVHGYRVEQCFDGRNALHHLTAGIAPDLILLDLDLPEVNGWEFRLAQRNHPEWAPIPIIVLSGDRSPQARLMDADRYLSKPVDPSALLDSMERLLFARDRARLDERSRELDRMTSLGVLTAGLAHELNNPLTFLTGNLQLASTRCRQLQSQPGWIQPAELMMLQQELEQAEQGAARIENIVRSVSLFSRPNLEQVLPMNVADVLESSLLLVANEIRHRAHLQRDFVPVPSVVGNPTQLGQVFINLLTNAAHAIPAGSASRNSIRVATRCDGPNVLISIADSGTGVPPDIMSRIFDPFFSTKAIGAGMGLGLSICQGIVSAMGGRIRVESELGSGTTFTLVLPAHLEDRKNEPTVRRVEPVRSPRTKPRPSLLVIDDEPLMGGLLRNLLRADYNVSSVADPQAALQRLVGGEWFDVVLCDLMMPELTGMDLHAKLSRTHPHQADRFVFMSGGAFTEEALEFAESMEGRLIPKPFNGEHLRRVLNGHLSLLEKRFSAAERTATCN